MVVSKRTLRTVWAVHKKNWLPLVPGPAFAIDNIPDPVCLSLKFSSDNGAGNTVIFLSSPQEYLLELWTELTCKFLAIDTFPSCSIMVGEVASLAHKSRNDPVENGIGILAKKKGRDVSLCQCVGVCVCVSFSVCVSTYIYVSLCLSLCLCLSVCVSVSIYICLYAALRFTLHVKLTAKAFFASA